MSYEEKASNGVTYKVIPAEEAPAGVFAPEGTVGMAVFDKSGEIVAYAGLIKTVTIDPIWIRPDKRRSLFILRRLWEHTKKFLIQCGAKSVGGVTLRHDQATKDLVNKIAKRLAGAKVIKMNLLHMDLVD
jgi:hypothetical protein